MREDMFRAVQEHFIEPGFRICFLWWWSDPNCTTSLVCIWLLIVAISFELEVDSKRERWGTRVDFRSGMYIFMVLLQSGQAVPDLYLLMWENTGFICQEPRPSSCCWRYSLTGKPCVRGPQVFYRRHTDITFSLWLIPFDPMLRLIRKTRCPHRWAYDSGPWCRKSPEAWMRSWVLLPDLKQSRTLFAYDVS